MSKLSLHNQLRRLAGLSVDYTLESTIQRGIENAEALTEARTVPTRRHEIAKKTSENMKKCVDQAEKALDHIEEAIACLERIPAIGFDGAVPHMIAGLGAILNDDADGCSMISTVTKIQKAYRSFRREEGMANNAAQEAEEVMIAHQEEEEVQAKLKQMRPILHIQGMPADGWAAVSPSWLLRVPAATEPVPKSAACKSLAHLRPQALGRNGTLARRNPLWKFRAAARQIDS